MSTVVIKSSSIAVRRPLEPSMMSDGTTIKLLPLDRGNFPMAVLLLYDHPIKNAANTIKAALSQALVHYYPFSGRFIPGGDGISSTGYIDCTGGGVVEFITASADCSLKQAAKLFERSSPSGGGSTNKRSLLDELTGHYPVCGYSATDPLLSVQFTEFTCGGFVVGVTWSHAIADGIGIAQFLGAIGELARGLSTPSVLPVRWDKAVSRLPPPPGDCLPNVLDHCPLIALEVTIPSRFISHIKLKAEFDGRPRCTTYEIATAVLWQCRTRATMSITSSPDTLSVLSFTVNVRKHVGAKDGYYGNCIVNQFVMATSRVVAGADVMDLVKMIKQAKDQVPDLLEEKRNQSSKNRLQVLDGRYNIFAVTSWRNIGFEEVDFGSGPPTRVMWHEPLMPPFPYCIISPNKGVDGVSAVSFCVKVEHADAFLQEIAKLTI